MGVRLPHCPLASLPTGAGAAPPATSEAATGLLREDVGGAVLHHQPLTVTTHLFLNITYYLFFLPWDEIESPSHWLQQSALPLSYQGIKCAS